MTPLRERALRRTSKALEQMHIPTQVWNEVLALSMKYERALTAMRALVADDPGAMQMASDVDVESAE